MSTIARVVTDVLFRDLKLKIPALLLAAIFFVVTRDEVTRSFEIPVRILKDPERVLLTSLPRTIQVKVVGPWTRVNRLQDHDFREATLDLRGAKPGKLEIDEASIVMPPGVVLADVIYDQVDLRFDTVITRPINVTPTLAGTVHPDYRITKVETDPPTWDIRGGRLVVQGIGGLTTEPIDIAGAEGTQKGRLFVIEPPGAVTLVNADAGAPAVAVRVVIEALQETREYSVPVAVPDELDAAGVIPKSYSVQVSGPLPRFRELDALDTTFPVEATVVPQEGKTAEGGTSVEVRFGWAAEVSDSVRSALSIDHGVERITLPPVAEAPPVEPPV